MMPTLQIINIAIADESKCFASAGNMAFTIVDIIHSKGRCTPRDLFAEGFTPAEVTQNWHLAHSFASLHVRCLPDGIA